jgi:hypothetical protein
MATSSIGEEETTFADLEETPTPLTPEQKAAQAQKAAREAAIETERLRVLKRAEMLEQRRVDKEKKLAEEKRVLMEEAKTNAQDKAKANDAAKKGTRSEKRAAQEKLKELSEAEERIAAALQRIQLKEDAIGEERWDIEKKKERAIYEANMTPEQKAAEEAHKIRAARIHAAQSAQIKLEEQERSQKAADELRGLKNDLKVCELKLSRRK